MRKGLSDIVTAILFILLILIAIGLIWAFLRPFISESLESQEGIESCYTLSIEPTSCEYANYLGTGLPHENTWPLAVNVKRNRGEGNFSSVRLIVTDARGITQTYNPSDLQLDQLEQRRFIAYVPGINTSIPQTVETSIYLPEGRSCPVAGGLMRCRPYRAPLRCAEFDCDGGSGNVIDFGDYLTFVALLDVQNGTACTYTSSCPRTCADFDGDGIVRSDASGFGDYFEFVHSFEHNPPVQC